MSHATDGAPALYRRPGPGQSFGSEAHTEQRDSHSQGSHYAHQEEEEKPEEEPTALVDFDLQPEEVIGRIESFVLWFLQEINQGKLPDFHLVSRATSNRALTAGAGQEFSLRLQQACASRSLVAKGRPDSADQYARILTVMQVCHELLRTGDTVSTRELYYRLRVLEIFRCIRDSNDALQDVVCLLNVPRSLLAVTCSGKGLVAGDLIIHHGLTDTETDCSAAGSRGHPIPGDISLIHQYAFQSTAQFILVIEKDAIFQRLLEDGIFQEVPCILVTAKGMPDMASRAFLHSLTVAFPTLPVLGLVDWNPSGVAILSTYKWGSHRMGLESPRYAIATLEWLGMRLDMLNAADWGDFQTLTDRDKAMAANMQTMLRRIQPDWAAELKGMQDSGHKAEIEAVYSVCGVAGFAQMLMSCLVEGGYV